MPKADYTARKNYWQLSFLDRFYEWNPPLNVKLMFTAFGGN